jgi:hypothetical protein
MKAIKQPGASTPISESPSIESSVQQGKVNKLSSNIQGELRIIREHYGDAIILQSISFAKE